MREVYKKKILKLLKHADYEPVKVGQLAKALGVESEDYAEFKRAFDELHHAGHVVLGDGSVVGLPGLSGRITGTFRANPRGFGFVTPLEPAAHVDLFIPPGETLEAMTGDVVVAKVVEKSKRGSQDPLQRQGNRNPRAGAQQVRRHAAEKTRGLDCSAGRLRLCRTHNRR